MGAYEPNPHHAISIVDFHNQPVVVALDVEHHTVVCQK